MAKKRRTYTREFKLDTIRLAETSDKPIAEIERDLGLSIIDPKNWTTC
jgi:transposase-like protein